MFDIVDGHHQSLPLGSDLSAFFNSDTSEGKDQLDRDEKIDFSKLEPLNPDGYM